MDSAFDRHSHETLAVTLFQPPLSPHHQSPSREHSSLLVLKFQLQDARGVCPRLECMTHHDCAHVNLNSYGLSGFRLETDEKTREGSLWAPSWEFAGIL